MSYAIVQNNAIISYPANLSDLQKLYPDTSFPKDFLSIDSDEFFIVEVQQTEQPSYTNSQIVVETSPLLLNGNWVQSWEVRDLTQDELFRRCDYTTFWDGLLISSVYQTIRTQACQDLTVNTCCTEFIAAMTDAKLGRANKDAIQMCINLLVQSLTLNESEVLELQSLMSAAKLDLVYTLPA